MEKLIRRLNNLVSTGKRYSKQGLLYEAAYRFGQAAVVIQAIYDLYADGVLELPEAAQAELAQMQQKLVLLSESMVASGGNGKHKMSGPAEDSRAKEGLQNVLEMLREDLGY
jgi:hypothetical protein